MSLTALIYSDFTDPASVNYETEDLGLGFKSRFPLSNDRSIELRYSLFTSKVKADSNATAYEQLLAGTDTNSMIGYSLFFDRRDSRYKPSKGFNLALTQDLAGLGGTTYYMKNKIEYNTYRGLRRN